MTKKMFFVFSLCCFMLSYSHFAMANASVISPIKTEKGVISPQKKGMECSFYIGGSVLVFVGEHPITGNTQISINIMLWDDEFYDIDIVIPAWLGSAICRRFGQP